MILTGFDITANFWKANPQLIIPQAFNDLYTTDKSKGKGKSSQIMWAIALLVDSDSKFSNISFNNRKDMIAKDYLKDEDFKWDEVIEATQYYESMLISPTKRQLSVWKKKMDEKSLYLDMLTYEENADTIEGLLKTNVKLFEDYERLVKMVEKEKDDGATKGGAVESASETGLI
jgi:hypothetical protein|tara:strand:+ start:1556 stop:2077 length:522 start_codon:yes stop_codon:yes gene_type:complete